MNTTRFRVVLFFLVLIIMSACSDSDNGTGTPPPETATVQFVYSAPTALDPLVASNFPQCVSAVGRTHLHASWRQFGGTNMTAVGNSAWQLTYNDVPVNRDVSIRVNDPNGCDTDPNGAVTVNIRANGVLLTRVVATPGNGTEPGLAFRVSSTGTVTP